VPRVLPGYAEAVAALAPVLADLPAKLVGIDGRDGTGKTTLGRYLAWHFNVTLVESDVFLLPDRRDLQRRSDEIARIINFRLVIPRPVIVEGVGLLSLLRELKLRPSFLIYVRAVDHSTGQTMERILQDYEAEFHPMKQADLVLQLNHGDS
jgi:hypothetical protein